MMKLLVITSSYPPHQVGGHEIRCKDVIDGLIARGHDALILTTLCPTKSCKAHNAEKSIKRTLHQKSEARSILQQIRNDIVDIRLIHKQVQIYQPDLIYLWGIQNLSNAILPYFSNKRTPLVYDEGGSGLIYLTKINKRGLYYYTNQNEPHLKSLIKQIVYLSVRILSFGLIRPNWKWPEDMRVYFNSHSSLSYAKDNGVLLKNAEVIYPGLEIDRFPFNKAENINNPVQIIVPGRVTPAKGTKDAVDLLMELQKRHIHATLKIIGKVQSEDYYEEIASKIKNNRLMDLVNLFPMVTGEELAQYYQDANFCFFPSYFKSGLSRVPLEAMASGCIVISYGNEGSTEIIQNGKTGFIVHEGDIQAAAYAIEGLIKNPDQYKEISLNARRKIEEDHQPGRYIETIENYLNSCLQAGMEEIIK